MLEIIVYAFIWAFLGKTVVVNTAVFKRYMIKNMWLPLKYNTNSRPTCTAYCHISSIHYKTCTFIPQVYFFFMKLSHSINMNKFYKLDQAEKIFS